MRSDSFFAYRLPGDDKIVAGNGRVTEGLHDDSFLIAPFENPEANMLSITDIRFMKLEDILSDDIFTHSGLRFKMPEDSTTRICHRREVEEIIKSTNGDSQKKTIAARVICGTGKVDVLSSFINLCVSFPDAYVFFFSTPFTGAWIGASPELLLKSDSERISTYALAGTRSAGASGGWDEKNITEQSIVKDFIASVFTEWGLMPECGNQLTKKAGNVEHILSEISSTTISESVLKDISSFLSQLSPTPALCGMPRKEALSLIRRLENFTRAYYGGFCGTFTSCRSFSLYVNIRSVWFSADRWCMFAGGGVTCASDPDAEWEETDRKSKGVLENLKFLPEK